LCPLRECLCSRKSVLLQVFPSSFSSLLPLLLFHGVFPPVSFIDLPRPSLLTFVCRDLQRFFSRRDCFVILFLRSSFFPNKLFPFPLPRELHSKAPSPWFLYRTLFLDKDTVPCPSFLSSRCRSSILYHSLFFRVIPGPLIGTFSVPLARVGTSWLFSSFSTFPLMDFRLLFWFPFSYLFKLILMRIYPGVPPLVTNFHLPFPFPSFLYPFPSDHLLLTSFPTVPLILSR